MLIVLLFSVAIFLCFHNVDTTISEEDGLYISKILSDYQTEQNLKESKSLFDDQIDTILMIQKAALNTPPKSGLIDVRSPREPKDLYEAEAAYCGDRSRFMHKALRLYGFDVRYVTIMRNVKGQNKLQTLLSKGGGEVRTHALVEVLTDKGWMVIDSRRQWVSLTQDNGSIGLKDIQKNGLKTYEWSERNTQEPWFLLGEDFYIFYGLYSRHGLFYEPYTPYVPDINWEEFLQNF